MMTVEVSCEQAEAMAGRICAAAAMSAQSACRLLELVGEFDAVEAVRWWREVKSLAHWLSWCCSMSPGTAREHVRVARGLRRMPVITAAFREGRLSYSKVREVTRVVGVVDEQQLCALALTATASQLARAVRGFRSAAGTRIGQQPKRGGSWTEREDGMVDLRVRLPKEEAATLIADAIVDVARVFLAAAPEDRSGEDRTLVVVHVAADQLVHDQAVSGDVPAGTPGSTGDEVAAPSPSPVSASEAKGFSMSSPDDGDVPAGTSSAAGNRDDTRTVQQSLRPVAGSDAAPRGGTEAEAAERRRQAFPRERLAPLIRPVTCRIWGVSSRRPRAGWRVTLR